jgi:dTDP-D-glucose 4,6-dehydratase
MQFAAQTHVDNSFGNSFEFTKTTFMGPICCWRHAK